MKKQAQFRVHIVFSEDETEATVTYEIWESGQRVAALVEPPVAVEIDVLSCVALRQHQLAFPTLFE